MKYSLEALSSIIVECTSALQKEQPFLISKRLDVNERTVAGEFAKVLARFIKDFNINCEYNRMMDENGDPIPKRLLLHEPVNDPELIYPDIIVHNQLNNKNNLLIIEMKMHWKNSRKHFDLKKLAAFTTQLHYSYGLYLEIDETGISECIWFSDGNIINHTKYEDRTR